MPELAGDDLAIVLFCASLAVGFGLETMKAETAGRRFLFGALTAACSGNAVFWLQIKKIWPPFTEALASVATNPIAWFVVAMFILAVVAFHPAKPRSQTAARPFKPEPKKQELPTPGLLVENTKETEAGKSQTSQPAQRVFTNVTPGTLVGLYKDRTSIQAKALFAPHIGKWISITGPVCNVGGDLDRLWVTLRVDDVLVSASCSKPQSERAIHFTNNAVITAQGRIDEVDRISVTLVESEFS